MKSLGFMKFGGKISYPTIEESLFSIQDLLQEVEKMLLVERATKISRRGNVITFSGTLLRFRFNARFISLIDNGFIRVTQEEQKINFVYGLSFTRLFWLSFPISMLFPLILLTNIEITFLSALSLFGLIFGFAFGINFIFSMISIFLFIKYLYETVYKTNSLWKILYYLFS